MDLCVWVLVMFAVDDVDMMRTDCLTSLAFNLYIIEFTGLQYWTLRIYNSTISLSYGRRNPCYLHVHE